MAVPSSDPYTVLKDLLENNAESPDGVWTVAVNDAWLEHRKMKTYQVCIQPVTALDDAAMLEAGNRTTRTYFDIVLYAPTREKRWDLYSSIKTVLNDQSLCFPMDAGGYAGVEGSDIQGVYVSGLGGIDLRWIDEECGPGADENCKGYRVHITVQLRHEE